ncbi:hypothetical protein K469DRAFT_695583 [Zopfia rhizophila CBS 207.26]|uniref:Uncharacterized protein n=1 Tax=Zopfia rhizophila CBS 207.26 TaxID=1314779 RepID=A0A6A6DH59_9PEZI|nr:hypothetical protein K469DRAFT_695583 [Zopfia rhizophila CBS 207.26]
MLRTKPIAIVAMDHLSVAGSIVGILTAVGRVAEIVEPFVSTTKDAPKIAVSVHNEVNRVRMVLSPLQGILETLSSSSTSTTRAAFVQVDELVVTFTDGVLMFSELESILSQLKMPDPTQIELRYCLQWAWKESAISEVLERLQKFLGSLSAIGSDLAAAQSQKALEVQISKLLANNHALSEKVRDLDDAFNANGMVERRFEPLPANPIGGRQIQYYSDKNSAKSTSSFPTQPRRWSHNLYDYPLGKLKRFTLLIIWNALARRTSKKIYRSSAKGFNPRECFIVTDLYSNSIIGFLKSGAIQDDNNKKDVLEDVTELSVDNTRATIILAHLKEGRAFFKPLEILHRLKKKSIKAERRPYNKLKSVELPLEIQDVVQNVTGFTAYLIRPTTRLSTYPPLLKALFDAEGWADWQLRRAHFAVNEINAIIRRANERVLRVECLDPTEDLKTRMHNWYGLNPEDFGTLLLFGGTLW